MATTTPETAMTPWELFNIPHKEARELSKDLKQARRKERRRRQKRDKEARKLRHAERVKWDRAILKALVAFETGILDDVRQALVGTRLDPDLRFVAAYRKVKSHEIYPVLEEFMMQFDGCKSVHFMKATEKGSDAVWAPGDDWYHWQPGTEPSQEMKDAIAEDLKDCEDPQLKIHGRCGALAFEDGKFVIYMRRQEKKVPFDKMPFELKGLMRPMPDGRNGRRAGYRLMRLPRDPFAYMSNMIKEEIARLSTFKAEVKNCEDYKCSSEYTKEIVEYLSALVTTRKAEGHDVSTHTWVLQNLRELMRLEALDTIKAAKSAFGGALKFVDDYYKIVDTPHFLQYRFSGFVTVELCGPCFTDHYHVPRKQASIGVHREQPTVPAKTFEDLIHLMETRVCEGVMIFKGGKMRKLRWDRCLYMRFHKEHRKNADDAWMGNYHTVPK